MNEAPSRASPTGAQAMQADLHELQREGIVVALPGLFAAAMLLVVVAELNGASTRLFTLSLGLCLLAIAVGVVNARSYQSAAYLLVIGCCAVTFLMASYAGVGAAIFLFALPVGLATLLLGLRAGAGIAIVCTVALFTLPFPGAQPSSTDLTVAIMLIWSVLGLTGLLQRPLAMSVEWSWSSYERSRQLLDQARDTQVHLKQTLQDLETANVQLARLNDFAQAMRQAAEEARRAKEQFVANVSHELRTPLNMIIGFAELMTTSPKSYGTSIPPKLVADLQIILRNSRHLSSLIDDVLDLSQIEAGRMAIIKERVALREVVEAAKTAMSRLFASKGLYLECEIAGDVPEILCDRTRVREVLFNLLSNAARFTDKGGVRLSIWCDGNDVVTSVADTGPGIDPAVRGRLFQPFEQLDGSIRRQHGGSGLGLSISKSFVELHGGAMWMESTVGQGTTVLFRLPVEPPAPLHSPASGWLRPEWAFQQRMRPSLAPPSVVRPRLLLLESGGDSLRHLLSRYESEADLVPVASLEEAVADMAHTPAQALVINTTSVAQTLQSVVAQATLPSGIPAIVCSVPEMVDAAHNLGASGYLVKPIDQQVLADTLASLAPTAKTILVVDDEPEALLLFMRMLAATARNYRVLTASNGREALRIIRRAKPDVVLLDLIMPEMDGFGVLAEAKNDPKLKDTVFLIISAQDPTGQPVVSNALAVCQGGGLTAHQLLASIEAMQAILSPGYSSGHPTLPESRSG